jgi:hypothetical protein
MNSYSQVSTGESLLELLAACHETGAAAVRLANQTRKEPLRTLLHERADRYRRSPRDHRVPAICRKFKSSVPVALLTSGRTSHPSGRKPNAKR